MGLTAYSFTSQVGWTDSAVLSGFVSPTQGPDGPVYSQQLDQSGFYGNLTANAYTIASGATANFNLWSFTSPAGNAGVGCQTSGMILLTVQPASGTVLLFPASGATGLTTFLNASGTLLLPPASQFSFGTSGGQPVASGAAAVSLKNVSGGTATGLLIAVGG